MSIYQKILFAFIVKAAIGFYGGIAIIALGTILGRKFTDKMGEMGGP